MTIEEKWVAIEGGYEVSDLGRVRSWRGWKGTRRNAPRLLGSKQRGYWRVVLVDPLRRCFLHNLVAETFLGPKPPGTQVDHIDRDKNNNAVSNLRYVSPAENKHNSDGAGKVRVACPCCGEELTVYRNWDGRVTLVANGS